MHARTTYQRAGTPHRRQLHGCNTPANKDMQARPNSSILYMQQNSQGEHTIASYMLTQHKMLIMQHARDRPSFITRWPRGNPSQLIQQHSCPTLQHMCLHPTKVSHHLAVAHHLGYKHSTHWLLLQEQTMQHLVTLTQHQQSLESEPPSLTSRSPSESCTGAIYKNKRHNNIDTKTDNNG